MNDSEKIDIQTLLDKIGVLRYQYSLLKKEDKFNIFEILRKRDEEVQLHSRFIAELLNPNGTHNQGNIFLNLFIKKIKEHVGNCNYDEAEVLIEESVGEIPEDDNTRGGRIDILITQKECEPIVIENKIYADDQENQLLRYSNFLVDKFQGKGIIIYLTLGGKEPSNKSLGYGQLDISRVILLSYENHITNWLSECIEKSSKIPGLRECLIQYQNLINDLTGNSTTMEERLKIISLLGENQNILNAKKIVENWKHLRWHVEWDYWNDFKNAIEKVGYEILDNQRFSANLLTGVIHKTQNRNPWYGITFKIGEFKGYEVLCMIERSFGDSYFGIRIENEREHKDIFFSLTNIIKGNNCFKEGFDAIWVGKESLNPRVNFESFNDEGTLLLCNPEIRAKTIEAHWSQIRRKLNEIRSTNQEELLLVFPND